jgi:hypothetical protein
MGKSNQTTWFGLIGLISVGIYAWKLCRASSHLILVAGSGFWCKVAKRPGREQMAAARGSTCFIMLLPIIPTRTFITTQIRKMGLLGALKNGKIARLHDVNYFEGEEQL